MAGPAGTRPPPLLSPPAETGPLTLSAAIARALATDGSIAVLDAALNVAGEARNAATDLKDPEVRVSYADGTTDSMEEEQDLAPNAASLITHSEESSHGFSAGLRFFPPHPWIRSAQVSAAEARNHAARMDRKAAEWAVSMAVSRLFADIRYLKRDAAILDELVAVYDDNMKLFKERAQARQVTGLDMLKVSQRRLQALTSRDRVRRQASEMQRRLAAQVDLPVDRVVLADSIASLEIFKLKTLTSAQLDPKAMVRADVSALYWRSLEAKAGCDEARSQRIPWFSFIEVGYAGGEQDRRAVDLERISRERADGVEWKVDVGIAFPLFSWANHLPALRRAEYQQAETALREAIQAVYRSFQDAMDAMRSLGARQAEYDVQSEPVLRELEATLKRLDKEPGLPPEQVIEVREQIVSVKRFKLEQDYEYQKGVVALEEVLGKWLVPVEYR